MLVRASGRPLASSTPLLPPPRWRCWCWSIAADGGEEARHMELGCRDGEAAWLWLWLWLWL